MANEKETVEAGAQTSTKKIRRGVSNKTQAVTQLKYHERDAERNGLFVGHLEEVKVDWSTSEDNKDFPSMAVPRLTLHFASNHPNVSERRHVYQTLFPVASNVNTIPGGTEEWKVNNVFAWIKHMLDVFVLKGRELNETEEDALYLAVEDIDEEGNYVPVEAEDVLAAYRVLFENAAAMLNGNFNLAEGEIAKAAYKTADGKYINCWLKLLRHKKRKNDWVNVTVNGDLGFDSFIGNGCVEIKVGQNPPSILRLDLAKESITPKETKKTPTIGAPGMMGGVMAGGPVGDFDNDAALAAGGDMPF